MAPTSDTRLGGSSSIPSYPTAPPKRDSDADSDAGHASWLTGHVNWLMFGLRYVMPVAIVLGGGIVMALGGETNVVGGAGIIGAGLAVYAVNWFYRVAVSGDRARDEEEAARVYLDVHGHWPDEASPAGSASTRIASPPVSGPPSASPAQAPSAATSSAQRSAAPRSIPKTRMPHPPHSPRPHTSAGSGRRARG